MDRELSWQELVRRSDAGKFAREQAEVLIEAVANGEEDKKDADDD